MQPIYECHVEILCTNEELKKKVSSRLSLWLKKIGYNTPIVINRSLVYPCFAVGIHDPEKARIELQQLMPEGTKVNISVTKVIT